MTAQLFLATTLQVAQAHVVSDLRARQSNHSLNPGYVLLPTSTAIRDMQRAFGDAVNIRLLDVYRLGRWILDTADSPNSELTDMAIRQLIYRLLSEMNEQSELTTFSRVWDMPGFVQVLVEWLREMKTQGIPPEDVAVHIANQKDQQLAILYERYQTFLRANNLSDTEGLLWLATEALEATPTLFDHISPLFVVGFDQFTPIVQRILRDLSCRLEQLRIYLVWDDEQRNEDSLALARLRTVRDNLIHDLHPEVHRLTGVDHNASSTLIHLRRSLFEPMRAIPHDGTVKAVTAPSREAEVRWALRAIKQQLLKGADIDHLALVTPNPSAYSRIIETVAGEYGIPVGLVRPLAANPAVQVLLSLLSLPPNFPWRTTFEVLHSPYIEQQWLSPEQIDVLDKLTRERPVVAGKDQWLHALESLDWTLGDTEDDDLGPPPLAASLPKSELDAMKAGLTGFFDQVTPSESGTYDDFILWLQEAVLGIEPTSTSLHMIACCTAQEAYAQRDLDAMQCLISTLRSLAQAVDLVPHEHEVVSWSTFRSHLTEALTSTLIQMDDTIPALQFGSLASARAQKIEYLYILGLSEGELPRPAAADVFYDPAERAAHPLPLVKPTLAESASVWWQVICNAQQSLTLLRPRIDDNGAPWQPSPYWTEVVARLDGLQIEDTPIDPQLTPQEAASRAELMIALARHAQGLPSALGRQQVNIGHAFQIIRTRKGWEPAGIYEGVLIAGPLHEELKARYGPGHGWSVSRLNRYGMCPFVFFAEHVLKLEARLDPETGLDAMQRGSLLHAILERLYHGLTTDNITPGPDTKETVLLRVNAACEDMFRVAPTRYGFRPSALWRYEQDEMRRMLHTLVAWECDHPRGTYRPFMQEARFGLEPNGPMPLPLIDANGVPYRLHGVIDRIDKDDAGNLRVIDYKSGSAKYSKADIEQGLALQTALYALAVEAVLTERFPVVESHYLHIPKCEISGNVEDISKPSNRELIEAATASAGRHVAYVRNGYFPITAKKGRACAYCAFEALCRANRQSRWKAQQKAEA